MVAMVDISAFFPMVTSKAPTAPIPEIEGAICKAAAELCRRLKVWKEDARFTVTNPGDDIVYSEADSRIHSLANPRFDGVAISFATPEQLDEILPRWQDLEPGLARYVTQMSPNTIRVVPAVTGNLDVRLVLYPASNAIKLPEFLLTDFYDTMSDGACGTLLAESTNPEFSNPAIGSMLLAKFDRDLGQRDSAATRPQIRAPHRTRGKFF